MFESIKLRFIKTEKEKILKLINEIDKRLAILPITVKSEENRKVARRNLARVGSQIKALEDKE